MAAAPASQDLVAAPTSLAGYMDEGRFYALAVDFAENVGDLIWPASVVTFAQMRNDPQLAAVLGAYTLPIRRATWAIDPAGCRDEVAQLVADDLGLPLLGDDTPGPARTRGVSWSEHLRAALLHLTYGHYGFEMLADVSSGRARLVGLYERVPATISFIHSTANGDFGGISQLYHPDKEDSPEIGPERMVWYCHDREGSAWHGRSALRAAYPAWLLKREMQRVLATSSRRFGMGVPTVEWAPGTTPTPEQIAAGQRAASAARVGDTAGLSTPPGAQLVLKGLSGGTPDTLAFIKWLDQQMSKMALAQFLDLGQTETGSRALGSTFVDLFTLSIGAIAEYVADTATRQAAARIVEWNWGTDEPVPRVTVNDVGTKHEITAEAIQQLMAAGAVQPDPELEAYVRSAFQLPKRSTPWTPPVVKGAPALPTSSGGGQSDSAPTPVAASRRAPRRRKDPAGQMALPIAAASAEPDPETVQQAWEAARAEMLAQWPDLAQPMVDDLAAQAGDSVDHGDLAALAGLTVPPAVTAALAAALTASMVGLSAESAGHVVAEAAAQGVKVRPPKDPGADRAGQVAEVTAALIASGYASAAVRKAMQVAGPGATAAEVVDAVRSTLTDMGVSSTGLVADNIGAGLSAAQNAGRSAVFAATKTKPKGYRAVEHNDQNACQPCKDNDQHEYANLAEAEADYPTGGFHACLGGLRCRGYVHAVWK